MMPCGQHHIPRSADNITLAAWATPHPSQRGLPSGSPYSYALQPDSQAIVGASGSSTASTSPRKTVRVGQVGPVRPVRPSEN